MIEFLKRHLPRILVFVLLIGPVAAQEDVADFGRQDATRTLLIRSTTDIAALAPLLKAYVAAHPAVGVRYEQWGSIALDSLSASACAGAENPADLVISSAVDLQTRLVNDGCAQPFSSSLTERLPETRNWRNELFGLTYEPAVIIYNRQLLEPDDVPRSRFDLIDALRPENAVLAGRVATYDIEESGLGYLFAFVDSEQANTFGRLMEAFGRSGAVATCCSAEIIDAVSQGIYLVGYNVLGSYALSRAETDPNIGVLAPADYTLVLSRGAYIPAWARNADLAKQFIDFTLAPEGVAALKETRLIIDFLGDDADLPLPGGAAANLRLIRLSPRLLVGLDQHKRQIFLKLWRENLEAR
ncbi:ABC transporter substrate-binding protein [Devosia sp.]|uniref:ABC transporter substrate-binding protein n=1 Tax=Devosia sp. TaxID=1871048 RepID=UPI003A8F8783